MQTLHIRADSVTGYHGSIVLLPGTHQRLEDFLTAGFDVAARQRRLPLDLILAAPALTHLTDRAWLVPLLREVIEPRRAAGQPLWLGGISLGAFRALRFAAEHPTLVDGLCLLAPYLGSRIVAAEIARCDSIRGWDPGRLSDDDDERRVWCYLRDLQSPPPQLFVGLSREDRFADTQRLLARVLPTASRCEIEGRHDWPAWQCLWRHFLDRYLQGAYATAAEVPTP
jgi:pimeloyl-ACP methyl ester carboxylesterase